MTPWLAEVFRRIGINEGIRYTRYFDTEGIPTIGIGFNLNRPDAQSALAQVGVSDFAGVMSGSVTLTDAQVSALFEYSFAPILSDARSSLDDGIFDSMSDARRFVICDLVYNLGLEGWDEFVTTRSLLNQAQSAKNAGTVVAAHNLFTRAANNLTLSAWYGQVGDRAKRDVAMILNGTWVNATADGSY